MTCATATRPASDREVVARRPHPEEERQRRHKERRRAREERRCRPSRREPAAHAIPGHPPGPREQIR